MQVTHQVTHGLARAQVYARKRSSGIMLVHDNRSNRLVFALIFLIVGVYVHILRAVRPTGLGPRGRVRSDRLVRLMLALDCTYRSTDPPRVLRARLLVGHQGPDHHLQASQVSSLPALASSPSFFRCTTASSRDRWSPSRKVPPSPARSPSHRGPAPRYTEGSELGRQAGSSSALFRPITSPDWGLRSSKSAPGHGPESGPSQTRKEGGGGALRDERARTSHATAGAPSPVAPDYQNTASEGCSWDLRPTR